MCTDWQHGSSSVPTVELDAIVLGTPNDAETVKLADMPQFEGYPTLNEHCETCQNRVQQIVILHEWQNCVDDHIDVAC